MNAPLLDPYLALGVNRWASKAKIKDAYHRLAKKYHPDLHQNDDAIVDKFLQITEAYKILGNDEMRAEYDRSSDIPGKNYAPKRPVELTLEHVERILEDTLPQYLLLIANGVIYVLMAILFFSSYQSSYGSMMADQLHAHHMLSAGGFDALIRHLLYLFWLLINGPWNILLVAALLAMPVWATKRYFYILGCWTLLFQAIVMLTLCFDSQHMTSFIHYYDGIYSDGGMQVQ